MKVDLERGPRRGVPAAIGFLVLKAVSEHVPLVWAAVRTRRVQRGRYWPAVLVPAETTHEDWKTDTCILRKRPGSLRMHS